ncbi:MAG: hypothetical protein QXK18_05040 [Candidatus Bathyarchaeia archaeon]
MGARGVGLNAVGGAVGRYIVRVLATTLMMRVLGLVKAEEAHM